MFANYSLAIEKANSLLEKPSVIMIAILNAVRLIKEVNWVTGASEIGHLESHVLKCTNVARAVDFKSWDFNPRTAGINVNYCTAVKFNKELLPKTLNCGQKT